MTELRWDGKYDPTTGAKCAPLKIALPFQTVETVNESAQERQKALELFGGGHDQEWRNRLIWGDKKYVLPSLLPEFAGKVDLIYIDPPFDTGANFSFTATIPAAPETPSLGRPAVASSSETTEADDSDDGLVNSLSSVTTFTKEPSILEQKAYRDTWGKGLDSYLKWFYETAVLLRDLLSEKGSIYVHLDWHLGHYGKVILDEVFGIDNFKNEIIWKRSLPHNDSKRYGSTHDVLMFYVKSEKYIFNQQFSGLNESYIESHYNQTDESGRKYQLTSLSATGQGGARKFGSKVLEPPKGNHWRYSQDKIDELLGLGRIVFTKTGTPRFVRYMDEMKGAALQTIWTDLNAVNSQATERIDYPTQKPEALLERIIKASSKEGDLVLDCFCGSGTTAATAEKLNRRWITCDLGRFAIHTARKRLLAIPNVKPFIVQNLGKYERQHWQIAEFGDAQTALTRETAYRSFILDLYRARSLSGYVYLHGVKGSRRVFVGGVDSPVSLGDLKNIGIELRKTVGTGDDAPTTLGVDILGWDFAFELNEAGKQAMANAGIDAKFVRIPREVLERKAVEQGDIKFFELAALQTNVQTSARSEGATAGGRTVTVTLADFVMPTDDVPHDVQTAITHWSQWIDYWAVDWDNKGDTFHNEWQDYRTRKKRDLQYRITHTYKEPGVYDIVIKVIDILGNDTTKTVRVTVS